MRIGIVSYFNEPNYGAMLQAWALQKVLSRRGHDVYFVVNSFTRPRPTSLVKIFYFFARTFSVRMFLHLLRYRNSFKIVSRMRDYFQIARGDVDAYIVGSDQMWGEVRLKDSLPIVMLDFAGDRCKRLSYAVSFGRADLNEELIRKISPYLQRFSSISVREKSGVEIVRRAGYKGFCGVVPDPVLLLSAVEFAEFYDVKHQCESQFLFDYMLDWDNKDIAWIENQIIDELGLDAKFSGEVRSRSWLCRLCGIGDKRELPDWMSKIKTARFVVTNSYHGTLFSIIFHRPFLSVKLSGRCAFMNDRLVSILDQLGLGSRLISAESMNRSSISTLIKQEINWQFVDSNIARLKGLALDYFNLNGL